VARRLVFLTQSYDPDDTILGVTRSWVAALASRCAGVDVIALSAPHSASAERDITVSSMGKERGASKLAQTASFYRALIGVLPAAGAIFVHMVPRHAVLAAPLALAFRKPIMLWYAQGGVSFDLQVASRLARWIITPGRDSFPLSGSSVDSRVHVTGHGIDTTQYAPDGLPPSQPKRLLAVGRLSPSKRYEALVEAVAALPRRDWRLRVAGPPLYESDHAYAARLRALLDRLGVAEQAEFLGAVPYQQVPDEYRRAWVLAHTSGTGSLDKVVLESMACATPVISTAPASQAAYGPLTSELWCEPHRFAGRLATALDWPDSRRAELGAASREQVERNHSLSRWADQVIDLLQLR
jgi:glycosyltransferase involved in cell wall biosynthesis